MGEDANDFGEAVRLEDVEELEGFLSATCVRQGKYKKKMNAPSQIQMNRPP